jgi:hypothetical protein
MMDWPIPRSLGRVAARLVAIGFRSITAEIHGVRRAPTWRGLRARTAKPWFGHADTMRSGKVIAAQGVSRCGGGAQNDAKGGAASCPR